MEKLLQLEEYIENENRSGDLDYAHYSIIIDYIFELKEEINKLKEQK